ncbi:MAG: hypothetical protein JOZ05_17830 [Acetobacteraceae bacterium]|nr:hypothetical protein [Acetobacteraceae bacterium]
MHPPTFSLHHHLSDWPHCRLELHCAPCRSRSALIPVRMLIDHGGDRPFSALLPALRCKDCGGKPAPVYLVAGATRTASHGPPPSWVVELVPPA